MLGLAGRSQHIMDRLFVWFTCIHLLCLVIAAKIVLIEPGLREPNKLSTTVYLFGGGEGCCLFTTKCSRAFSRLHILSPANSYLAVKNIERNTV